MPKPRKNIIRITQALATSRYFAPAPLLSKSPVPRSFHNVLSGTGVEMFGWLRRAPPPPTEQQQQVWKALSGYPPYSPAVWDPRTQTLRDFNLQYRAYFLGIKEQRLDALSAFLARFDVALNLEDAGLMAVSTWLPHYGDLLLADFNDAAQDAYRDLSTPRTEVLQGLNPMFDIGVYYAECLWFRRTKLKWFAVVNDPENKFSAHLISGCPGGKPFDPIDYAYSHCQNIRRSKEALQRRLPYSDNPWHLQNDSFHRHVLSNAPPGRRSHKMSGRSTA